MNSNGENGDLTKTRTHESSVENRSDNNLALLISLVGIICAGFFAVNIYLIGNVQKDIEKKALSAVQSTMEIQIPILISTEMPKIFENVQSTLVIQLSTEIPLMIPNQENPSQENINPAIGNSIQGNYTIVVSSNDKDLEYSKLVIPDILKMGLEPNILKIDTDYYTTAGDYFYLEQLQSDLKNIRMGLSARAYYIKMSDSCPKQEILDNKIIVCSE